MRGGGPAPAVASCLGGEIADVRRHRYHTRLLTLDHCLIEVATGDGGRAVATLHVAILEPPGAILVWHLAGEPADPGVDAGLLIAVERMSTGVVPNMRVRLAARGATGLLITEGLAIADVPTAARLNREPGLYATGALGSTLSDGIVRRRLPQSVQATVWLEGPELEELKQRIERTLAPPHRKASSRSGNFRLVARDRALQFLSDM